MLLPHAGPTAPRAGGGGCSPLPSLSTATFLRDLRGDKMAALMGKERGAGKVSLSRHPGRAGGPYPSLLLGLPPQPGAPESGVTATPAVMKGGRGEVCGLEAAIREPGTFDMQKPRAPLIALAGLVPKQAPSPGYQEQTSC